MAAIPVIPWMVQASPRRRWLVGVSGGADSVALLRLLAAHGFRNLVVCHLDHGLRGRAAAADAGFVRRLAAELGLPCETARVDVARVAGERKESVETAARRERHGFFANCARKYRCRRIILAHHADDQAETILWNLLRGSHGLKGMAEGKRIEVSGHGALEIHRPLLGFRRQELRACLEANGWPWREDATNAEPVAARNRLRNEGIPLLDEIAGRDTVPLFVRAATAGDDTEEITRWALGMANVRDPQGRLHVPALRELPAALQRAAILAFLRDSGVPGVTRELLDQALGLLIPDAPSRLNLPGGGWLRRRAGRIEMKDEGLK